MVMDGRGRIVCAACNADLGPSGKPDETNVEDMCEECGKKMLRKAVEGGVLNDEDAQENADSESENVVCPGSERHRHPDKPWPPHRAMSMCAKLNDALRRILVLESKFEALNRRSDTYGKELE